MSLTVKLALTPVLVAQALRARARMPRLPEAGGERQGTIGEGPVLRLLVAGDSSAAGVGVARQRDALADPLAARLAKACGACVDWRLVARSGLTTAQTLHLLQREGALHADVAVIVTGVNDVIEQVPSHHAVSVREALVNWLRNGAGVHHVVFAPLPPVHLFPGLPQPLRWVAGSDALRHNRALQRWAQTRSDASTLEIALPLDRGAIAADGFHPGKPVYRACADAIASHIASHLWPRIRATLPPPREDACHAR